VGDADEHAGLEGGDAKGLVQGGGRLGGQLGLGAVQLGVARAVLGDLQVAAVEKKSGILPLMPLTDAISIEVPGSMSKFSTVRVLPPAANCRPLRSWWMMPWT